MLCVGVRVAHFDLELGVKEQDEGDDPVVAVHVQQERVLDHQPPPGPAVAELVVPDAVQALDAMTAGPLEDGPLPGTKDKYSETPHTNSLSSILVCFGYKHGLVFVSATVLTGLWPQGH